ncbi:hypothetical protein D3C72_2100400 [compost metagenome]
MTLWPRLKGKKSSKTERSKQMEVDASIPSSISEGYVSRAQRSMATALLCSIATPLGLPVEPEV